MSQAQNQAQAQQAQTTYLVEIWLVENPKAMRKRPFVARVKDNGELEFLRAAVPRFEKGTLVGGKYVVREGDMLIVRSDSSTHRHEYTVYELCTVKGGKLETIARILIKDGTPEFEPPELEKVYAEVVISGSGNIKNKFVQALIEYAKRRGLV